MKKGDLPMKNNYVLTIEFSTEKPLDMFGNLLDPIAVIGTAMTKAFGVDSLTIARGTLHSNPPQTLAKKDASGRWYLPKPLRRNRHV